MAGISLEMRKWHVRHGEQVTAGRTLGELQPEAGAKASGQIRYKLGQLYGVEFVEITPEQLRRIQQSCKKSPFAQVPARNA